MKLLIVIPARGGSKGIPLKNIYPVCGKPLLEYAIECAINSSIECDIVVSTDSEKITEVARRYKEVIIIKRPESISHDTASTESALIHAIKYCKEELGIEYEHIMTLPATSPLRKAETVKKCYEEYLSVSDTHDAMLSLHATYNDHWVKDAENNFSRLYPNAPRRRQEREPLYIEDSAIYITQIDSLIETNFILGKNPTGFVIDEIEGIDINEPIDIDIAEKYIMSQK